MHSMQPPGNNQIPHSGAGFLKMGSKDHWDIFKTTSRIFSMIIKKKASPFMNTKPSKNNAHPTIRSGSAAAGQLQGCEKWPEEQIQ